MGNILRNPRYERYAHGIVAGLSRQEAYKNAGFNGKTSQAWARLERNPDIQLRIKELMSNAAARAEFSRKQILDRIVEDWELARKLGQVASALKAAELYGRDVHKMFTERKEVGGPGDFDNKTEAELREIIQKEIAELGWDEKDIPPPASAIN